MTGREFQALLALAGLTVRDAATLLEVNKDTIVNWRHAPSERSPIPYWAVKRLRDYIDQQKQEGDDHDRR